MDYGSIMADAGRGYALGRAYLTQSDSYGKLTLDAYDAFRSETIRQFEELSRRLHIVVTPEDPYTTHADLFADVQRGRLAVLATSSTGSHPYLSNAENDAFRAVHDFHGHFSTGRDFSRHGEEAAWTRHSLMYSPLARLAMTSETRGQNSAMCWVLGGQFAPQTLCLMPEWATRLN